MIKTYGERGDSYLGRRVKHELMIDHTGIISSKNIPCEAEFLLENVDLKFDGPDENYRPWMEFSGYVKTLTGDFPCNIREIDFSEKKRFDARFRYDFSDDELAELAKKGLFSKDYVDRGLNEPDIFFKGNILEFPVLVDVNILKDKDGPKHAVFVDINSRHYIEIDAKSSGYTDGFAQHYADLEEVKQKEREENEEMFLQTDEYIERIGDIELLDTIPENSYMLSMDDEYDMPLYTSEIDEEREMSLFEKYNIEEEVNERNEKYRQGVKRQAEQYKAEQEAKATETALEQEERIEEKEEAIEDNGRLLDIDLSEPDEEKRKKERKREQIAKQQQVQRINLTMENMGVEEETLDINDFEFM